MKLRAFVTKNFTWVITALITIPISFCFYYADFLRKPIQYHDGLDGLILFSFFFRQFFWYILIFFFVVLPLKVIYLISKGNPFEKSNIKNLHAIAYFLIVYYFGGLLFRYLLYLQPKGKPIPWLELDPSKYAYSHWKELVISFFLFIIAKAFKRGYSLQKEQELTI